EEHNVNGGLGSLVAELLAEGEAGVALIRLGIGDGEYAAAGAREPPRALHGIDAGGIFPA
ncbi:transketolase family protein, partial [Pseudomonas syringae pv. tagetis]